MVAAAISGTDPRNPPRDRPNNGGGQRRPRGKQVPSRYLSPSPSHSLSSSTTTTTTTTTSSSSSSSSLKTSKRYPSPLLSNSASNSNKTPSFLPKRSQSVDRRRPSPSPATEMSAATKMLITSTRSLSVSFQGEAFSLPISKKKETAAAAPVSHRKPTPERRRSTPVRDHRENSKPVDQQLWPGASRSVPPNPLSRSLDCGNERGKLGSGESPRVSINGRLSLDMEGRDHGEYLETGRRPNNNDLTASDTDSVSSGSTNGGELSKSKSLPRNVMASARFWQETNTRLRRLQDPGSPLSSSPGLKTNVSSSKFGHSKRFSSSDAVPSSSPRGMASPVRVASANIRSASPSKLWATTTSSPARALSSPSRVRNEVSAQMNAYNRNINTPSILSFSADVRRGKIGEDRVMDAHLLRLLYNRYLQWRFVNARTEYTLMVQRLNAEKNLWNAWVSISELRHSVTLKRIKLLLLRQKLKLASILRGQMGYLEEWSLMDRDHSSSLSGATEALKASTLRLPIVGKTVVDIQDLKHAVSSAVDVMQAMSSSIFSLTLKVDEMNSVMVEAVNVTAKEKVLLERCQGFLSRVAAMQVTDCSMKTHIIQLRPITSSLTSQQL
ncbi:QWRF motif-containing protein 2 [Raphanus sativus]|uniref:QWRF motif-containing protein 2 n=1 Tax=Raphanus sativus TaxID=3726 RepID=A0A6J0JJV7_RAPSA|nr:QWRF motif-containing protein 2 [Raphanus sativus]KAJ4917607.1 QWRF motif-containing protein 2 [Raphanus sativus]